MVLKAGSGTIKVGSNSVSFSVGSQSPVTGNSVSFVATSPVKATTVVTTTQAPVVPPAPTNTNPVTVTVPTTPAPVVAPASSTSQTASANLASPVSGIDWLWIILLLVVILAIAYFMSKRQKKS